jgi:hypothetical protein
MARSGTKLLRRACDPLSVPHVPELSRTLQLRGNVVGLRIAGATTREVRFGCCRCEDYRIRTGKGATLLLVSRLHPSQEAGSLAFVLTSCPIRSGGSLVVTATGSGRGEHLRLR